MGTSVPESENGDSGFDGPGNVSDKKAESPNTQFHTPVLCFALPNKQFEKVSCKNVKGTPKEETGSLGMCRYLKVFQKKWVISPCIGPASFCAGRERLKLISAVLTSELLSLPRAQMPN